MCPKELGAIQEAIEPATRRLAEMETCHARTASTATTGVERTPRLPSDEVLEGAVERGLENGLEAAEHEISARRGVDDEGEMVRQEVLRETISFDSGKGSQTPDRAVSVGVEEREERAPQGLELLLCRPRDVDSLQQPESGGSRVRCYRQVVTAGDQMVVDGERIESKEEGLGPS